MPWPRFIRSHAFITALAAAAALLAALAWLLASPQASPEARRMDVERSAGASAPSKPDAPMPAGPPWRYGRADARFTVVEYADLECPFCRGYFAVLKRWVDAHPEVNWQWHHLPLSMHEPAASAEARLVECAGQDGGHAAFWKAVEWVYANTRGDGHGLPEGLRYPDLTPEVQRCLDSDHPDAAVHAQAAEAAQQHISATPTLRLQDRESGTTLMLPGPVESDALLSAIDLLAAGGAAVAPTKPATKEMHGDTIGDMTR